MKEQKEEEKTRHTIDINTRKNGSVRGIITLQCKCIIDGKLINKVIVLAFVAVTSDAELRAVPGNFVLLKQLKMYLDCRTHFVIRHKSIV